MTAEENYRLLLEIEANRDFILNAYRSNPALLARVADPEIRRIFEQDPRGRKDQGRGLEQGSSSHTFIGG